MKRWNVMSKGNMAMRTQTGLIKPTLGMILTFTSAAEPALAGLPAKVVHIWPRFRSGDYLVTLEYAESVKLRNEFIHHIDAFMSELSLPNELDRSPEASVRPHPA